LHGAGFHFAPFGSSLNCSVVNTTDPLIGDYTGLPINDAARLRADSWTAEKWTQEEHECEPHPADYTFRSPGGIRIWPEFDALSQAVVAWHIEVYWMNAQRTIYMDGREAPPPYAAYTWEGFSTGKWEGDKLEVKTVHLKEGWLRRNGVPRSEKASLTEYFIRHGDFLTIVSIVGSCRLAPCAGKIDLRRGGSPSKRTRTRDRTCKSHGAEGVTHHPPKRRTARTILWLVSISNQGRKSVEAWRAPTKNLAGRSGLEPGARG